MGEDLIVSTWGVKGRGWKRASSRARGLLRKAGTAINRLSMKDLGPEFFDLVDEPDPDMEESEFLEEVKSTLRSDLEEVRQAVGGGHREATWVGAGDMCLLVTGGMSWGDAPTTLFDPLNRLLGSVLEDDR
jgi:hypothetical protein